MSEIDPCSPVSASRAWRWPRRMLFATALLFPLWAYADESMDKAWQAYESGDFQQALEIWLLKAYEADAEAQYRLGLMFAEGTGTVADPSEAVYWYTRAAEQGHAAAQYELGNAWFHGTGTTPDKAKALEWWRVAAENGYAQAQYVLGRAYFYGIDIVQDSRLAVEWFTRAAEGGNELARDFLARIGVADSSAEGSEREWDGFGRVGERSVRVYSSFNRLSPILTRLEPDTLLRVVGQRADWFRVEAPGGFPVWVPEDGIEEFGEGFRVSGVGIQARPDPDHDPAMKSVGMLPEGEVVVPIEYKDGWVRVQAPESLGAWVEAMGIEEIDVAESDIDEQWRSARELALASRTGSSRAVMVLAGEPGPSDAESDPEPGVSVDGASPVGDTSTNGVPASPPEADFDGVAAEIPEPDAPDAQSSPAVVDQATAEALPEAPVETLTGDPVGGDAESVGSGELEQSRPELFSIAAADADFSPGDYLRVGPGGQSIYARDRLSSARIDRLPAGLLLRVVERRGDWVAVQVPGGLSLWIYSRFITHDGESGRITGEGVRARPLPSTASNSQPVGVYPEGARVRVVSVSDPWVRIRAPEEMFAWMQLSGLYLASEPSGEIVAQWQVQGNDHGRALEEQAARFEQEPEPERIAADDESTGRRDEGAVNRDDSVSESTRDDGEDGAPDGSTVTAPVSSIAGSAASPRPASASGDPVQPVESVGSADIGDQADGSFVVDDEDSVGEAADGPGSESVSASPAREVAPAGEEVIEEVVEEGTPRVGTIDQVDAGVDPVAEADVGQDPEAEDVRSGVVDNAMDEVSGSPDEEVATVDEEATEEGAVAEAGERMAQYEAADTLVEGVPEDAAAGENEPVVRDDAEIVSLGSAGSLVEDSGEETAADVVTDDPESVGLSDGSMDAETPAESGDTVPESASDPGVDDTASTVVDDAVDQAVDQAGSIALRETAPGEAEATPVMSTGATAPESGAGPVDDGDVVEQPLAPRFDDLAWLYRQSPDAFSIEVMRGAERESVIRAARLIDDMEAVSFSSREGGTLVYNLMVGAYPDLLDVQEALGALQSRFDTIRIRRLGAVQQEWCDELDNLTPEQLLLVLDKCGG